MTTYKTAEVAAIIGIHPNTVRLYEKLELIPKPRRLSNGYRVFTEFHIKQCKLIRLAFQVEVLQNGLRKKIAQMIKRMEKLIKKINKKLKHLGKEEQLELRRRRAQKANDSQKEELLRNELKTRRS